MFTGIVEGTGVILGRDDLKDGDIRWRVALANLEGWANLQSGESLSLSGACHTLESLEGSDGLFFSSLETISRTNMSQRKTGDLINLERPLRLQDRLGGHLVSGHIDGTAELVRIEPQGDSYWLEFQVSDLFTSLIIPKGSVALDGISLTVARIVSLSPCVFAVAVIPHTWQVTNLTNLSLGSLCNLEIDQIAKYVVQKTLHYLKGS